MAFKPAKKAKNIRHTECIRYAECLNHAAKVNRLWMDCGGCANYIRKMPELHLDRWSLIGYGLFVETVKSRETIDRIKTRFGFGKHG